MRGEDREKEKYLLTSFIVYGASPLQEGSRDSNLNPYAWEHERDLICIPHLSVTRNPLFTDLSKRVIRIGSGPNK